MAGNAAYTGRDSIIIHYLLHCHKTPRRPLDKFREQLSQGGMRRVGSDHILAKALLNAALAFSFFIMAVVQPGFHAMAKSSGMDMHPAMSMSAHGDHAAAVNRDAEMHGKKSHRQSGGETSIGKACEVQCAAVSTSPEKCFELEHALARCYAPSIHAVLKDGEPENLIRPPRHLI